MSSENFESTAEEDSRGTSQAAAEANMEEIRERNHVLRKKLKP